MDDVRQHQRVATQQLLILIPCQGRASRPAPKPLLPNTSDRVIELPKTRVVRCAAVILVVASQFRVERGVLFFDWFVAMCLAPCRYSLETALQALLHRPHLHHKSSSPAARTDVC